MKKLYRCRWNKKLGGVLGGLGQYLRVDPTILRILFVISLFFTMGISLLIYLIAWALIPVGPSSYIQPKGKKLYRNMKNRKIAGVCSGFASFFCVDPSLVRIITVVVAILTGIVPVAVCYFLFALIIPPSFNLN